MSLQHTGILFVLGEYSKVKCYFNSQKFTLCLGNIIHTYHEIRPLWTLLSYWLLDRNWVLRHLERALKSQKELIQIMLVIWMFLALVAPKRCIGHHLHLPGTIHTTLAGQSTKESLFKRTFLTIFASFFCIYVFILPRSPKRVKVIFNSLMKNKRKLVRKIAICSEHKSDTLAGQWWRQQQRKAEIVRSQ